MKESQRSLEIQRFTHNIHELVKKRQAQPTEIDLYTQYLDGLKGNRNQVINFEYIMRFKQGTIFADFLEGVKHSGTETDYAGFHAIDPNWYEEGDYRTGAIEPELFGKLEQYFKGRGLIDEDQELNPIIHFSQHPGGQHWDRLGFIARANMVINVSGGERDDWGQFITCWLDDGFQPFHLDQNQNDIDTLKKMSEETGNKEVSAEEYWKSLNL